MIRKMINYIKELFKELCIRIAYDNCYSDMEDQHKAAFGICDGSKYGNCKECPYRRVK